MNLNFNNKELYTFSVINPDGTEAHSGLLNEKSWNKTLENGVLWEYIEEGGRVLEKSFAPLTINPAQASYDGTTVTIPLAAGQQEGKVTSGKGYAFLEELQNLLRERKKSMPENSYTTHLFQKGEEKILKKLGEETVEVILASIKDDGETIYEAADLIYHLMVLFVHKEIDFKKVIEELESRMK